MRDYSRAREQLHARWHAMRSRCRSVKKFYGKVTVCPEWEDFEVFFEWGKDLPWEGRALDKDILSFGKGCKVYSPLTCVFVPQRINNLVLCGNSVKFKRVKPVCTKRGKVLYRTKGYKGRIETYSTEERASSAYNREKMRVAAEVLNLEDPYDLMIYKAIGKIYPCSEVLNCPDVDQNSVVLKDLFEEDVIVHTLFPTNAVVNYRDLLKGNPSNTLLTKITGISSSLGAEIKKTLKFPEYQKLRQEEILQKFISEVSEDVLNGDFRQAGSALASFGGNSWLSLRELVTHFPSVEYGTLLVKVSKYKKVSAIEHLLEEGKVIEETQELLGLGDSDFYNIQGSVRRKLVTKHGEEVLVLYRYNWKQEDLDYLYKKLDDNTPAKVLASHFNCATSTMSEIIKKFYKVRGEK